MQAQTTASVPEAENLKDENQGEQGYHSRIRSKCRNNESRPTTKTEKCEAQQQLKRLKSKHKNVVATLEAEVFELPLNSPGAKKQV